MLDEDGVLGSAHTGIGTNITLDRVMKDAVQYDLVLWKSAIDLDGKIVVENG